MFTAQKPYMKPKLIVFDLDGTLIHGTEFIWTTIHDHLGVQKEQIESLKSSYLKGKINYDEWARRDVELWKEQGANREKIVEAISHTRLMDGAIEVLKRLKEKKIKLAIISGSLDLVLKKSLPDYWSYFDYVFLNKLMFNEQGKILGIEPTQFDLYEKANGLRVICEKEGIDTKDAIFIGDHSNDVEIAEEAGFSIAFNPKSQEIIYASDIVVKGNDLREVLEYLNL